MRAARRGRPPVEGVERYPSGRRKPSSGDPRGPALAQRAREAVRRRLLDPRWASEVELLGPNFTGDLSESQVETANLIGRIYGAYERFKRRRRTAASPSYMRAFGDPDGAEDPENPGAEALLLEDGTGHATIPREPTELERKALKAQRRFDTLQGEIDYIPVSEADRARVRSILEELCVENRRPLVANLPSLRAMLDRIGSKFGRNDRRGGGGPPSIAITARSPARRTNEQAITAARRRQLEKEAYIKCQRAMNPKLKDFELELAWQAFHQIRQIPQAIADRERFRAQKRRGRA